ncbi:MAG: prepilin-type N-terminal cleavage/methylation domain-containing protein [Candidatus Omnitrophica bacterium]|nr:prepilin-type N-terminal cleavage/methylation domain-containing protein [Candidatus Omnitrophota bacterium]MBU4488227.1 prepilin-type N-terminal cleavage/methylation domain-containing protein [Candidatus Omnitrophota bacterium]MCG2705502.1 prepilin-type N-terminal cleavage/methylation domain-containing protein [Candidatus Omnitrophota bacterium]
MTSKSPPSFTLIELLIALSIFAVVAVTLYSTFFAGISVWKRSGDTSSAYQDIRVVFDDIARDLKDMIYFTKDGESAYAFIGAPNKVIFMTLEEYASPQMKPAREVVRVSYYFDTAKEEFIKKRADISLGFDIEKAEEDVLLRGVKDFQFEYCYDSGDEDDPYLWQEEWEDDEARIPRGIRIVTVMKAIKSGDEASEITRVIFIPTGVLGKKEL